MKKIILKTGLTCLSLLIFNAFIQAQVTEKRNIENFSRIDVSGGIDLVIKQGAQTSVIAEAKDDQALKSIITKVESNTLKIYSREKTFKPGNRKVYVTFEELEGIKATGGSDVMTESKIEVNKLELQAHGGTDLKMVLSADAIDCTITGGSDADLSGKVRIFSAIASGGSDIRAKELDSEICNLEISGGSDATVMVSRELNVQASGGSDVFYHGNPNIKNVNTSGGSDLIQR